MKSISKSISWRNRTINLNDFDSSNTLNLNIFHFEIKNSKQHDVYVYQKILIKMFFEFRKKIIENYQEKKVWTNLIAMFTNLNNRFSQKKINIFKKIKIDIVFKLHDELIYYIDDNFDKLCISKFLKKKIFRLTYNSNQYIDVYKNYFKIVDIIYISRFLRKIRVYVKHYFVCQINQTKQHKLYEELISIITLFISFHTIAINFVLNFLDKYDCFLIVTNKFSRQLMLILDYIIDFVVFWDKRFLFKLQFVDWDVFSAIIFDKNSKFISNLWKFIFEQLRISLFMSIVYHFQSNDLFEKSNQIVEIVIKYLIICYSNTNWWLILFAFQTQLNNFFNSTTRLSSNELIYDFKIKNTISFLTSINELIVDDISQKRLTYCNEIKKVFVFANVKIKIYYDTRYTFFLLNFENKIYFRLNHEYCLSNKLNRKLSFQRCDSFSIKQHVDKFVYEIKILNNWRIHLVVFII